jgi:hypothetical protein
MNVFILSRTFVSRDAAATVRVASRDLLEGCQLADVPSAH